MEKLPQGEKMEATSENVQQMSLISNRPTKSLNIQITMTKYLRQIDYKMYEKSVDPGRQT